jgi:hypothetical protein
LEQTYNETPKNDIKIILGDLMQKLVKNGYLNPILECIVSMNGAGLAQAV